MEIIVLGSGAFAPARKAAVRNPAGYAARLGRDVLLFDLGFGNLWQLARANLDPSDVSDVFLTHRHPDHVADLAALLFLFRYGAKPRSGRLRVWGPRGLARFLRELKRAYRPWLSPKGYRLEVRELAGGARVSGAGWEVSSLRVEHPTPALAYRLLHKSGSFAYSGDAGASQGLAEFAAGCDIFVLECTQPSRRPLAGHLTPREAIAILESSGCRRGVLSHVSEESAAELRRLLKGRRRLLLARDLMTFHVE